MTRIFMISTIQRYQLEVKEKYLMYSIVEGKLERSRNSNLMSQPPNQNS